MLFQLPIYHQKSEEVLFHYFFEWLFVLSVFIMCVLFGFSYVLSY